MVISRYDWLKYSRKCIIRACGRGRGSGRASERGATVLFPTHSLGFLSSLSLSLCCYLYIAARGRVLTIQTANGTLILVSGAAHSLHTICTLTLLMRLRPPPHRGPHPRGDDVCFCCLRNLSATKCKYREYRARVAFKRRAAIRDSAISFESH